MGCDQWVIAEIERKAREEAAAKAAPPIPVVKVEIKEEKQEVRRGVQKGKR